MIERIVIGIGIGIRDAGSCVMYTEKTVGSECTECAGSTNDKARAGYARGTGVAMTTGMLPGTMACAWTGM